MQFLGSKFIKSLIENDILTSNYDQLSEKQVAASLHKYRETIKLQSEDQTSNINKYFDLFSNEAPDFSPKIIAQRLLPRLSIPEALLTIKRIVISFLFQHCQAIV